MLGSGDAAVEYQLDQLKYRFPGHYNTYIGYNERLAHIVYAAADFLLMPSRVEPCGLNQMYSMRYGTVPIVRYIGGLKDTVQDISTGGSGINFSDAGVPDIVHAIKRAMHIYNDGDFMRNLIHANMNYDFSWERSAENYVNLYRK